MNPADHPPGGVEQSSPVDRYGEFCALTLAAEILADRWTPLIVRELLAGHSRFNDLHR
jgi:DNA-binding HxlR family transcriptional regulator